MAKPVGAIASRHFAEILDLELKKHVAAQIVQYEFDEARLLLSSAT